MISIEVTTTAMCRPEILDRTYASFHKNLKGVDWENSTCHINVDPLPEGKAQVDVLSVVGKYFGHWNIHVPKQANFPAAYKWLWKQPENEWFLNLEDDWKLTERVLVDDVIRQFDNQNVNAVALRAYSYAYRTIPLSPSFYRTSFFKDVSARLNIVNNPETQLHDFINKYTKKVQCVSPIYRRHHMVKAYPYGINRIIVNDIGREWMEKTEYTRPQLLPDNDSRKVKKCNFTKWVKK